MPPTRKPLPAGMISTLRLWDDSNGAGCTDFEDDPDNVNNARCKPCSEIEQSSVILHRNSISSHLKSAKHQKYLVRCREIADQHQLYEAAGPAVLGPPPSPALNTFSPKLSTPSVEWMDIENWTFTAGEEEDPRQRMERLRAELNQLHIEEETLAGGDMNYDDSTQCDDSTNPWRHVFGGLLSAYNFCVHRGC